MMQSQIAQHTSAMAIDPLLVKVLSLRLRTCRFGLCFMAAAKAMIPGWLIPFCGIWTSSRLPNNCEKQNKCQTKEEPKILLLHWVMFLKEVSYAYTVKKSNIAKYCFNFFIFE